LLPQLIQTGSHTGSNQPTGHMIGVGRGSTPEFPKNVFRKVLRSCRIVDNAPSCGISKGSVSAITLSKRRPN
jgi:hypothetical protein